MTYNGVTLNRPAFSHHFIKGDRQPGAWVSPNYWYRLVGFDGLWGDPVNVEIVQLPQQNQTRTGDRYTGGKTIVLTGIVEAKTLADLRTGQVALRKAFSTSDPNTYDLAFTLGGTSLKLQAGYANQPIQMPDQQNTLQWKRPFVAQLYFDDPTVYTSGGGSYSGWS